MPGGRSWLTTGAVDHRNLLWIYGGYGYGMGDSRNIAELGDLWQFNLTSLQVQILVALVRGLTFLMIQWAWMGGTALSPSVPGIYGTCGM